MKHDTFGGVLHGLGIGQRASAVRVTVARGMSMDRDGFPGAVHAYGARRGAPRMAGALPLPTREHLARNVPERSEESSTFRDQVRWQRDNALGRAP